MLHGEAVGFGILAACFLSKDMGFTAFSKTFFQHIAKQLTPLAHLLPPWKTCLEQLYLDKKSILNECNHTKMLIHCIMPCPNAIAKQQLLPPEAWRNSYDQLLNLFA